MSASCSQAQAYLDRALAAAEAAQFEAHAAGCADCRKLIDSWEKFQEAYRTGTQRLLSEPTRADAGRLLERALGGPPVTRRPLRWAWVGAGALAAAAVIALFVVSGREPLPDTPAYAVDAAGHRTSVSGGALEAGTERPATFALGQDMLGLSAGSRVELAARDSRRVRIELKRGSVAAAVHHREKGQSFEVHVGGATVFVVGTRFRVSALPEGFGVDVAEGHVRVEEGGRTYDVLGGQSLRAGKGDVRTAPSSVDDFPELHPERAPAEPDAGANLEAPDAGAPAEATHEHLVPASRIAAWRHAIVAGDAVSVIDEARRAARESPRQAELWEVLADAYRHGGSNAEAAHAYERAIALANPEQADHSRILLASLWMDRLNDPAHAEPVLRAYLRRVHGIVPDAQARVSLAKALRALGREADARRELERVVRQYSAAPAAVEAHDLLKK